MKSLDGTTQPCDKKHSRTEGNIIVIVILMCVERERVNITNYYILSTLFELYKYFSITVIATLEY
jgi:hypothetical protein